jgi:hypothetical protein
MNKFLIGTAGLCALVIAFTVSTRVYANFNTKDNDRPDVNHYRNDNLFRTYNPNNELSESSCGSHLGRPVVDVTQKVVNDIDDGVGSNDSGRENNWAFDYYTRHITVWNTGPESANTTFCAIVTYNGQFNAIPGQIGPGNNPTGEKIHSPVNGSMSGGYRATFTGTLSVQDPTNWPAYGHVNGTTDYACVVYLNKNDSSNCLGVVDWLSKYFTSTDDFASFTQPWWGWKYDGGSHGTWINSSDGNTGNIL